MVNNRLNGLQFVHAASDRAHTQPQFSFHCIVNEFP